MRLIVWLPPEKAEVLKRLAQEERRDPRDQAAYLIDRALARRTSKTKEAAANTA
jgi:hypothetical protein